MIKDIKKGFKKQSKPSKNERKKNFFVSESHDLKYRFYLKELMTKISSLKSVTFFIHIKVFSVSTLMGPPYTADVQIVTLCNRLCCIDWCKKKIGLMHGISRNGLHKISKGYIVMN